MLPEKLKAIIKEKKKSIHIHSFFSSWTFYMLFALFSIFAEQLPYAFSLADFSFHLHWSLIPF